METLRFGRFQGEEQVGRVSTAGEENQDVAGSPKRFHLPGKNLVVTEVVTDTGQGGGIRRQGDGGKGPAIVFIASDQFLAEMERIGGAASVAGGQDFLPGLQGIGNHLRAMIHRCQGRLGVGRGLKKFVVLLLDDGIHEMRELGVTSHAVMKIFFRYLFVRLLIPFSVVLFSCTVIWIMIDLYGNVEDFLTHKVGFKLIAQFYSLQIPSILVQILPATLLISIMWTLLSMNRRSELVAFQSGGLSPLMLFSPFVLFSMICAVVFAIDLYAPAASSEVTRDRLLQQVKGQGGKRNVFTNLPYIDTANRRVWYFQNLDVNSNTAKGVEILQRDAQKHDIKKYFADSAKWTGSSWSLANVLELDFAPDGSLQAQKTYVEKKLDITTPPSQLSLIVSQPEQLTVPQLTQYIKTSTSSQENLAKYRTEWWYRVLHPLSLLVLMIFALLQGLRTDRRSAVVGVVGAIIVLLLYIMTMNIFMAAGKYKGLPPFVAVLATPAIFAVIGLSLMAIKNGWFWQLRDLWQKRHTRHSLDRVI